MRSFADEASENAVRALDAAEKATLAKARVLVIGMGGLGCPAALCLARAGVGHLVVCDDDRVDPTNLHRQILFTEQDVGRDKLEVAKEVLEREANVTVEVVPSRFLPDNALELARRADLLMEGADNFATKFLTADAGRLSGKPVVHGAAVRWHSTVWSVGPAGRPCYRCLFEDVLTGDAAPNCAEAGVMGPIVGLTGALMADLALDLLLGRKDRVGLLHTYDGRMDRLRRVPIHPRGDCPLCGTTPSLVEIREQQYLTPYAPVCAESC